MQAGFNTLDATARWPYYHPEVFHTESGVPYLKEAGYAVIGQTIFDDIGLCGFLRGFDEKLGFEDYLDDEDIADNDHAAALSKVAGQLCYMSFGPNRTKNKDAQKYLDNIKEQRHGSVLEHASVSILLYGIDRSVTHELVRHRVGIGFSQVSQRYVDGTKLRFCERPEYQKDDKLHQWFQSDIEDAKMRYDQRAERLMEVMKEELEKLPKTDRRKRVNQAARSCLPNETEAPIVVSANWRTWRHLTENRTSEHAELLIRAGFNKVFDGLKIISSHIMNDYVVEPMADGTRKCSTAWRKV